MPYTIFLLLTSEFIGYIPPKVRYRAGLEQNKRGCEVKKIGSMEGKAVLL